MAVLPDLIINKIGYVFEIISNYNILYLKLLVSLYFGRMPLVNEYSLILKLFA